MSTKALVIRAAGKRGKTKRELADAAGIGYSQAAKVVNDLILEGKLVTIGKLKSRAEIFARAPVQTEVIELDTEKPLAEAA